MRETLRNFKSIACLYDGDKKNLNYIALEYQRTGDSMLLAVMYVEMYPYLLTQVRNYFQITEQDKASYILSELHQSMLDFSETGGATYRTFSIRYIKRRLFAETSSLNRKKRIANEQTASYDQIIDPNAERTGDNLTVDGYYEEEGFDNCLAIETLESSPILTNTEIGYCKIILRESSTVKDIEIAEELKVSSSAITQAKKSLRKKLVQIEWSY